MMQVRAFAVSTLVALTVTFAPLTADALDPAPKCEAGKLKIASKYGACRLSAESKGIKKGEAPDFSKCTDKFSDKWQKTEDKAGPGVCPSESDEASIDALITEHADVVAAKLSGMRFEDCGDGTVVDHQTGLMWQKTDDGGGLTDKDNVYTWTSGVDEPSGTAFTVFLQGLNNCESIDGVTLTGGYAGHCDWRMPQIDELATIVDCSFLSPCIDESVFGPVHVALLHYYWSATTDSNDSELAWTVFFSNGISNFDFKSFDNPVRAVRSGPCP